MKVRFNSSFAKDLKAIQDNDLKVRIKQVIELIEKAQTLQEIKDIRKLKGGDHYYRIRLKDYRFGEWLISWSNEFKHMCGMFGMELFMQLP